MTASSLDGRDVSAFVGRRNFLTVVKKHGFKFFVFEIAFEPHHHRRVMLAGIPASNVVTAVTDRDQPVVINVKAKQIFLFRLVGVSQFIDFEFTLKNGFVRLTYFVIFLWCHPRWLVTIFAINVTTADTRNIKNP